ncbi:DUF2726 domain-containing protein [Roseateles sp. BYS180W]|uniref:DUF2726 domain-containing protein n=1 Tax=Roseateles rivi TaxID=3299028 RepID=A0ABW7FXG3_9BURK
MDWTWKFATTTLAALLGLSVYWHARAWWQQRRLPTHWALSKRPVFARDERRVHRHLREALADCVVLSKLPLIRLCQSDDIQERAYWYRLLGTIHAQHVVCSASGRVLLVLEHDNRQSERAKLIKLRVLRACSIPYLHCSLRELPSADELRKLMQAERSASTPQSIGSEALLPSSPQRGPATPPPAAPTKDSAAPRTARNLARAGASAQMARNRLRSALRSHS